MTMRLLSFRPSFLLGIGISFPDLVSQALTVRCLLDYVAAAAAQIWKMLLQSMRRRNQEQEEKQAE